MGVADAGEAERVAIRNVVYGRASMAAGVCFAACAAARSSANFFFFLNSYVFVYL